MKSGRWPGTLLAGGDPKVLAGLVPETEGARDWGLVDWVGRLGAVSIDQIRIHCGMGRTAAYRRVSALVSAGLLERVETLRGQPALLRATGRGLRLCGLPFTVVGGGPELVGHWLACGTVAVTLESEFGSSSIVSERELRFAEALAGKPLASARLKRGSTALEGLHRPDLAVRTVSGVIAVEVELTPKAPRRLEGILRGWNRSHWVEKVRYYTVPGPTARVLSRTIRRTSTGERIEIHRIGEIAST